MRRVLCLFLVICAVASLRAQYVFRGTSLSEVLIALDQSSKHHDISFVYDELEDFTVSKTIARGTSLPDAVREVCGFYPIKVTEQGREIFVECLHKERTKLTGRLLSADGHPVPYANIVLFSVNDSALLGGGVSNEAGDFVIPCAARQVNVRISCIGFKTIQQLMPVTRVGVVRMQMDDYRLQNVTVKGVAPVFRTEAGRLLYLVANDPFARSQDGFDLLSRMPMVTMDDGKPAILGRGVAGIMFNGRLMPDDGETVSRRLRLLRAEDIERIEVISLPYGRHRTASGSGLINIVTSRDPALGWRGDLNGLLAANDDWNCRFSGAVNYATGQFDASLDVFADRLTDRIDNTTLYDRPNEFFKQSVSRDELRDKDVGMNLMLHCHLAPKWEAGAMISYKEGQSRHNVADEGVMRFGINYAPFGGVGPDIKEYTTASVSSLSPIGNMRTVSLTAYTDWKLDTLGKQVSLTCNYYSKSGQRGSLMEGDADVPIYYYPAVGPYHILSAFQLDTDYRIHSVKLDFLLPFPAVRLEAGLAYTGIDNTVLRDEEQASSMGTDDNNFNEYGYLERNFTTYLMARRQLLPTLSATLGLHWEYSWMRGEQLDGVKLLKTRQQLGRLLPSLTLDFLPAPRHQLTLNMGRVINRPVFDDLNQVPVYMTMTNLISGNPALSPGLTDFADLTYSHPCGLLARLYYHHGKDQTEWITRFQIGRHQEYTVESQTTRPENWLREREGGLSLFYKRRMADWLNAAVEGTLYYYHGRSGGAPLEPNEDEQFNPYKPDLYGWGKTLGLSADVFLNRGRTLLFHARYNQWFRRMEKMADYGSYGYATLALRYAVFDDRLRLSLEARDPFWQHQTNFSRSYNWFVERVQADHHTHFLGLTASYALGGKHIRRTHRDKKNAETQRAERQQNYIPINNATILQNEE